MADVRIRMVETGDAFSEEQRKEYVDRHNRNQEKIEAFMKKEFGDMPFFMFYEEKVRMDNGKGCQFTVGFNGGKNPSLPFLAMWTRTEAMGRKTALTGCFCGECKD